MCRAGSLHELLVNVINVAIPVENSSLCLFRPAAKEMHTPKLACVVGATLGTCRLPYEAAVPSLVTGESGQTIWLR